MVNKLLNVKRATRATGIELCSFVMPLFHHGIFIENNYSQLSMRCSYVSQVVPETFDRHQDTFLDKNKRKYVVC